MPSAEHGIPLKLIRDTPAVAPALLSESLDGLGNVHEWQSDFARKYMGVGEGKGLEKGRMEEAAQSLLRVLAPVGATVSDSARTRIENCTDLDTPTTGWTGPPRSRMPKSSSSQASAVTAGAGSS